ncbi:MAG: hypothetical protein A2087_00375 [Spirochaetes bacterium GWD1_61_31]|nr:MAG: hypothetical protein A2Y37_00340 [Spirochaetes bacterium GWB1_60_80]OHD28917.1 MAG: hypothetical protein A2004_10820 [Spirochaetes bacterium GWC1_61_12]OHD39105.1 MAG: hypothetical protein A2087_00375 [Spirochaetes bacterium GWD1_61_31]OHD43548.1 MAG: hypothetical protein A2Y35_04720 [Spirochaetes bacterium GWE1_60_18]OHD59015.1 MAG: hypothetical protein A2Y32_01915 [Spirochaetes bacterium GWF1_60_12]
MLRETLGIMVYQEDVARVAMAVAGFDAAAADRLRKILAKKRGADKFATCTGGLPTAAPGTAWAAKPSPPCGI